MKLRVIVEVVDGQHGVRRRKEIEIPDRVLKDHGVLCESRDDLQRFVAEDVLSNAIGTILKPQGTTEAMDKAIRDGGTPGASGSNKLGEMLGLDIIDHMDNVVAGSVKGNRLEG